MKLILIEFQVAIAKFSDLQLLKIVVVGSKDLVAMDTNLFTSDSSDPYVKVRFGDIETTSKVIKQTLNPTWDFHCQLAVPRDARDAGSLEIEVWDEDKMKSDDFLGRINVPVKELCHSRPTGSW